MVALADLSIESLQGAIREVLTNFVYRESALRLKEMIREADGFTRAADIVETVIRTGQPVVGDDTKFSPQGRLCAVHESLEDLLLHAALLASHMLAPGLALN
jgi:hypothetical protein